MLPILVIVVHRVDIFLYFEESNILIAHTEDGHMVSKFFPRNLP